MHRLPVYVAAGSAANCRRCCCCLGRRRSSSLLPATALAGEASAWGTGASAASLARSREAVSCLRNDELGSEIWLVGCYHRGKDSVEVRVRAEACLLIATKVREFAERSEVVTTRSLLERMKPLAGHRCE